MELQNRITPSNLSKYCRTCLTVCQDEVFYLDAMPTPIIRLFKQSVSYKRSHKIFPNHLCSMCYSTLRDFEEFRSKALRSTRLLEQALKTKDLRCIFEEKCTDSVQQKDSSSVSRREKEKEALKKRRYRESSGQSEQALDFALVEVDIKNYKDTSPDFESETVINSQESKSSEQSDQVQIFEEIFIKTDGETEDYKDESLKRLTEQPNHDERLKINVEREISLGEIVESEKKDVGKKLLYICSHCDRSYRYPIRLDKHLTKIHNIKNTLSHCPHENCNRKFQHNETAMQHKKIDHERTAKRRIKPKDASCICEDCGRIYKNVHKLKEHRYQHEPMESRPFHCEQCNKRFITKRSYDEHLLRHAGIKAFQCPYCDMKKTSARELRSHINVHTKEKKYPCPLCPRVFHRIANLKIHDRVVHKRIRQFNCQYCDQSFGKPDTLKYHEMRHTGEKPYKCNVCEKSFIQPSAFKTHMKTHNKQKD